MRAIWLCMLAACYRSGGECAVSGTCVGDEAGVDVSDAPCFGADSGVYRRICPGKDFKDATLDATKVDTSVDCDFIVPPRPGVVGELPLCGLVFGTVHIADVTAAGDRPLLVFARTLLSVEGLLDVASRAATPGVVPAGATIPCPDAMGASSISGGGGGAGGSFGTAGGPGGAGNDASGGTPSGLVVPLFVRAGCAGSAGGSGSQAGGAGGKPGGAVYLMSPTMIDVVSSGTINASGAGAPGGAGGGGGGGGGSGGMIVFDAPSLQIQGRVFALGGGGGSGATQTGGPGGEALGPGNYASGGIDGTGFGGAGGRGAAAGPNGDGENGFAAGGGTSGGGGGGGGVGVIKISSPLLSGGNIDPMPTP